MPPSLREFPHKPHSSVNLQSCRLLITGSNVETFLIHFANFQLIHHEGSWIVCNLRHIKFPYHENLLGTHAPQGDMVAVWQICQVITAKERINETRNPS